MVRQPARRAAAKAALMGSSPISYCAMTRARLRAAVRRHPRCGGADNNALAPGYTAMQFSPCLSIKPTPAPRGASLAQQHPDAVNPLWRALPLQATKTSHRQLPVIRRRLTPRTACAGRDVKAFAAGF